MEEPDSKSNIYVSHVQEHVATEQERRIGRALIALARVQVADELEDLADELNDANAQEQQARKQAVRQRRAERRERREGRDTTRPKDNRPSGKPDRTIYRRGTGGQA